MGPLPLFSLLDTYFGTGVYLAYGVRLLTNKNRDLQNTDELLQRSSNSRPYSDTNRIDMKLFVKLLALSVHALLLYAPRALGSVLTDNYNSTKTANSRRNIARSDARYSSRDLVSLYYEIESDGILPGLSLIWNELEEREELEAEEGDEGRACKKRYDVPICSWV
jgi:hypothetical protein